MRFRPLAIISIFLALWLCTISHSWSQQNISFRKDDLTIKTRSKRITFKIEIAETPTQRANGLMWRQHLAEGTGMLFDFKTTNHVLMWMKNTLIPLDLLFIKESGVIENIVRNSTPKSTQTIPSEGPVRAVLEIPGGSAKKYDIQRGDIVTHSIFKP